MTTQEGVKGAKRKGRRGAELPSKKGGTKGRGKAAAGTGGTKDRIAGSKRKGEGPKTREGPGEKTDGITGSKGSKKGQGKKEALIAALRGGEAGVIEAAARGLGFRRSWGGLDGAEVAAVFRVTGQAVTNWAGAGCPRDEAGKYDLAQVIRWRWARARAEIKKAKERIKPRKGIDRIHEARADIVEMERDQRRKLLIERVIMEKREEGIATAVLRILTRLPREEAPRVHRLTLPQIEEELWRWVEGSLKELGAEP